MPLLDKIHCRRDYTINVSVLWIPNVDFICDFIESHTNEPFFVYYPMNLPHCPFVPTPDSADWDPESIGSPTYKGNPEYFGDMVAYMDKLVGRILDTVEEQGLSDRTIILFTGDNGTDRPVVSQLNGREVAGAKGKTTDAGTRVPLIVGGAGVESQVVSDLVDFTDFLPTLCDIANVELPDSLVLDGRSFLPQLRGNEGEPREWIYCWYSSNGKEKDARVFARTHEYKLYRNGEFFHVPDDPLEKQPLPRESLTESQLAVRETLQGIIDTYAPLR